MLRFDSFVAGLATRRTKLSVEGLGWRKTSGRQLSLRCKGYLSIKSLALLHIIRALKCCGPRYHRPPNDATKAFIFLRFFELKICSVSSLGATWCGSRTKSEGLWCICCRRMSTLSSHLVPNPQTGIMHSTILRFQWDTTQMIKLEVSCWSHQDAIWRAS